MSKPCSALGIDTSNYTTSAALYDGNECYSSRKLLPVPLGERGLRQSDAVFAHVKQFPEVFSKLAPDSYDLTAVGVSSRPRCVEGSYMPCFIYGVSVATTLAKAYGIPLYEFSHQQGHIAAALYSAKKTELTDKRFLCFHVSGGTTELLEVNGIENIRILTNTSDISVGQLIDRAGVMLGFSFPSGKYIEESAKGGILPEKPRVTLKNGCCALSGFENKTATMINKGVPKADISLYILEVAATAIKQMTLPYLELGLPIVYVGGVMSDLYIRNKLEGDNVFFASPEYSSDNAAGIAWLAYRKKNS